ncbi:MAG: PAS domain S-box protein [Methanomicrobium sp.]|nr:PAS domain S-box protein [Methanomicrobium sp.]
MTKNTLLRRTGSENPDKIWLIIIGLFTALAFTASYISLSNSQSYSVANIFLIPIILASFIYQRKGIIYTVAVTVLFVILAFLMNNRETLFDTGIYAVIMIGIGLIITLLSIALHKTENRYKILFETSPAPMIVTDSRNIIRDVNDSLINIFGYDRRSLIGKDIFELEFIPDICRGDMRESIIGREIAGRKETGKEEAGKATVKEAGGEAAGREEPVSAGAGMAGTTADESSAGKTFRIHIADINGNIHTCQVYHSTLRNRHGGVELRMIGMLDITENVIAQKNLRISLKEKEMLIREVHHRVKNNLQVIVSLLKLQMNRTEDEQACETLRDCQTRIYSMAMVHEKLYRSEGLAEIDVREYLENLARNILIEYSENLGDISIEVTGDSDLSFDLDTIVPCALITNELITNSYKYAFPDKRAGKISIDISMQKPVPAQDADAGDDAEGNTEGYAGSVGGNAEGNAGSGEAGNANAGADGEVHYIYTYRDNGVGFSGAGKNGGNLLNNPNTLGMKIIRSLVRQLNGVIEIKNSGIEAVESDNGSDNGAESRTSEGTEIIINFRGKL